MRGVKEMTLTHVGPAYRWSDLFLLTWEGTGFTILSPGTRIRMIQNHDEENPT